MCSRNNDLSEEKKRMRIIISGGRNRGVSLHNNYSEGRDLWCAADHPTIFRFFFLSLSIQLCKKKKKHCLPSLDHTTPLSPLPFSLSARPLLPSECSRLMHPPLFSLLFTLISKLACFFPPTKRVCSVFFQPWPLEQERIRQTAMDALYPPKERTHGQKKRF